jgi:hypothetical protein
MALTCNIDAKGKRVRLIYGLVLLVVGIALIFLWAARAGSLLSWIIAVCCLMGGAFGVFEARAGWCAIRAMGIKTPL